MARKDQEKKIGVEEGLREKERKREEWKSRKEEEEGEKEESNSFGPGMRRISELLLQALTLKFSFS